MNTIYENFLLLQLLNMTDNATIQVSRHYYINKAAENKINVACGKNEGERDIKKRPCGKESTEVWITQ